MKTSQSKLNAYCRLGIFLRLAICRMGIAEVGHHSQVAVARDSQNEWVLIYVKAQPVLIGFWQ